LFHQDFLGVFLDVCQLKDKFPFEPQLKVVVELDSLPLQGKKIIKMTTKKKKKVKAETHPGQRRKIVDVIKVGRYKRKEANLYFFAH